MTSASFGSATRHIARNSMMKMAKATTITPTIKAADPSSVVTLSLQRRCGHASATITVRGG